MIDIKKIHYIQKDTRLCKFILFTKNLHFLPKKLLTACSEAKFIYPLQEYSHNNKAYRSSSKRELRHYRIDIKEISDFMGLGAGTAA